MGKSLIIPGADFSANAIDDGNITLVSDSQTNVGGYWKANGQFVSNVPTIRGTAKIAIPEGVTKLQFRVSSGNLEPSCIVCWNGATLLGAVPVSATVGLFDQIGEKEFILPAGATEFSYVYKNLYSPNNYDIGLSCVIVGLN